MPPARLTLYFRDPNSDENVAPSRLVPVIVDDERARAAVQPVTDALLLRIDSLLHEYNLKLAGRAEPAVYSAPVALMLAKKKKKKTDPRPKSKTARKKTSAKKAKHTGMSSIEEH